MGKEGLVIPCDRKVPCAQRAQARERDCIQQRSSSEFIILRAVK